MKQLILMALMFAAAIALLIAFFGFVFSISNERANELIAQCESRGGVFVTAREMKPLCFSKEAFK